MGITQTQIDLIDKLTNSGASQNLITQIVGSFTNEQCLRMTDFLDKSIKNQEKLSESQILEAYVYCRKVLETRQASRCFWKEI